MHREKNLHKRLGKFLYREKIEHALREIQKILFEQYGLTVDVKLIYSVICKKRKLLKSNNLNITAKSFEAMCKSYAFTDDETPFVLAYSIKPLRVFIRISLAASTQALKTPDSKPWTMIETSLSESLEDLPERLLESPSLKDSLIRCIADLLMPVLSSISLTDRPQLR